MWIALSFLANFAAGLFLCNTIPHLVCGLRGEPFPTPFAKPPGVGFSSAVINTLWGFLNLILGCVLLHASPIAFSYNLHALTFFVGFLAIGLHLSWHFAKVRRG